jgi:iron(III) transport system ATP-binding protein
MSQNALELKHITKSFGTGAHAAQVLHGVDLSVREGQLVALLGPSGCGKTTLLRIVAGFEKPDRGTVAIHGRTVASETISVPPEDRRVGMVFQEYALFPHLDVSGNVSFGLKGAAAQKSQRTVEMLETVGLPGLGKRAPHELSGGQQQRVALARALAPNPVVLLLDEPFSNLDAALRGRVRGEVKAILKSTGTTGLFVTHDQEEALSLADEVAVMFAGRIVQMASPQQLYLNPATKEVATFVGEANFIPGTASGDRVQTMFGALRLAASTSGQVDIMLRPEQLRIYDTNNAPGDKTLDAHIAWREFYGHDQRLGIVLEDGTALVARTESAQVLNIGDWVKVSAASPVRAFPR